MKTFVRWVMFSVLVSVVPLGVTYALRWTNGTPPATVLEIFVHGELLLISIALAADAMGEVITAPVKSHPYLKVLGAGGCIIIVAFASLFFASVSAAPPPRPINVSLVSVCVLAATVVAGGSCKVLAEDEHA